MTTTATEGDTLTSLDFTLPCENIDGCPFEAPAEWLLSGTPPCQHDLSILICDYCRIQFQKFVLDAVKSGAIYACGVCCTPFGRSLYDWFQLTPLRPT